MLQENIVVEVERRTETGKNAANRLRAKDLIPAVIYGGGARTWRRSRSRCPRKTLLEPLPQGPPRERDLQAPAEGDRPDSATS